MRVNLTSEEFTQIEIPAGTVQNLSPVAAGTLCGEIVVAWLR